MKSPDEIAEECAGQCNDCIDAADSITTQTRCMEQAILAAINEALAQERERTCEWVKEPLRQGTYWHWNGSEDSAPFVLEVLWSGTSRKCFVAPNQIISGEAIDCDLYGGWWMEIPIPKTPTPSTDSNEMGREG